MIKVTYNPRDGQSYRDGDIESAISAIEHRQKANPHGYYSYDVASELFILGLRVAIKQGHIPHDQVKLTYCDGNFTNHDITIDADGLTVNMPEGVSPLYEEYLIALLEW